MTDVQKEYQIEALDMGGLIVTVNVTAYDAEEAEVVVANDPSCKQVVSVSLILQFKHVELLKRYEVQP